MKKVCKRGAGFSMMELLFATFIFTIIAGSVFSLLMSSQMRYQSESNLTEAFQQANVAIDQITRDVHSAGYPPISSVTESTANNFPELIAQPFAWSPNYPIVNCKVNGIGGDACEVPGPYDLILETDLRDGNGVQWIRYKLTGTTLMRGVAKKEKFADPVNQTDGQLTPYLENVINETKGTPIFSYKADFGAPAAFFPPKVREVNVCLTVQSAKPDQRTGQTRSITLTGQAVRFNPSE